MRLLRPTSLFAASAVLALAAVTFGACSSESSPPPTPGPNGGPVSGTKDNHCGTTTQAVNKASCNPPSGDAGTDAASDAPMDMGTTDGGEEPYPPTMFNDEGDDDDCKYHVKWSSASIHPNEDDSFTVVLTTKSDGKAAAGVPVRVEAFLSDTHPAPNTAQTSKETSTPGTYTVGPIRFDASGKWTVRFHFHEDCVDLLEDSPHGHAAFFVNVP